MKLHPSPTRAAPAGPVVLLILDGVGEGPRDEFDAVHLARKPNLDRLRAEGSFRTLAAHGLAVGLPSDADMGNSEVGHNIMGAGRIFSQGARCVEDALEDGSIWTGPWRDLVGRVRAGAGRTLHLIGLLSDGNVHSHQRHLYALLERAAADGVARVRVHALLDGRDVPDRTAERYVSALEERLAALRTQGVDARIASGGGRMAITMDRYEADWAMVQRGWEAQVLGRGRQFPDAAAALAALRAEQPGVSDQFLPPFVIAEAGAPVGPVQDGDAVVLFNFRGDRAIEVSRAFTEGPGFDRFDRERVPDVLFAGMMMYDGDAKIPEHYLVSPKSVSDTLSQCLADSGVTQFACAETQKYGHVTYFWNGNVSAKFSEALEDYLEIPSDQVPFEQRPWMKAAETADAVIAAIQGGRHRFIRANFAGGDMVGHSGQLLPTILAVEAVDLALGRIVQAVQAAGGILVVTADHGNADDMVERNGKGQPLRRADGSPVGRTSHTLSPVPFIVWEPGRVHALRADLPGAGLANIAATLVELLGLEPPGVFAPSLLQSPAALNS
jgi:2,3-bisphosphoglycerate-independent phosphoglycerate mutase